jgi:GNAT superfamily N-acetyltransferase
LGVLAEYRKMGIEAIFFAKNIQEAKRRGLTGGEASWVLENNDAMIAAANQLGGERYKTYRLYKMKI